MFFISLKPALPIEYTVCFDAAILFLSECPAFHSFVSDTIIKSCTGSLRGIIEGISGGMGNVIRGGVYQNCAFPQI